MLSPFDASSFHAFVASSASLSLVNAMAFKLLLELVQSNLRAEVVERTSEGYKEDLVREIEKKSFPVITVQMRRMAIWMVYNESRY